jgi:hypothetical protein
VKSFFTSLSGLAALAVLCLAHAANATPVGSLSCATETQNITFNISYFTFGFSPASAGSATGGAGAGKVTYQPLDIHAALSSFVTIAAPTADSPNVKSCTISTTLSDGASVKFVFKDLVVNSLTVVAERRGTAEAPAQYVDVQLEYGEVSVTLTGGVDDGGTLPADSDSNRLTN